MKKSLVEKVFAKQPIIDREENIVAYELLYRDPITLQADFSSGYKATLKIVDIVMELLQVKDPPYYFINADRSFLMSHQIELLTPHRIVIEVLEDVELTSGVLKRIRDLRDSGFKVALDDIGEYSELESFEYFDILKFDLLEIANLEQVLSKRNPKTKILAEKVEERGEFERLKEMGFDLFQGYFFAKPLLKRKKRIDPLQQIVINILNNFIYSDIDKMVHEIKREPTLALKLIQYVNAAYFYRKDPINSVKVAISYIGLNNLKKWLYLQLYNSSKKYSPIFNLIQSRVFMMEELAKYYGLDEEIAYFIGIMSLMDVALDIHMDEVLKIVKVNDTVREALKTKSGKYGKLLEIVEKIEKEEYEELDLDGSFINHLIIGSMKNTYFY